MQVYKGIILMNGVGYDSNVYLIDGEVLVDCGTGSFFSEIKDEIENCGWDVPKIKTIVNTHCHFDHTGADKKFRDWLKADIAIHENDQSALETGDGTLANVFGETSRTVTVDKKLKEGDRIKTKHFDFKIVSTPGHTPGSICLYDKMKKILISGDTIFESSLGRVDYPGGNEKDMLKSIKKLSKLDVLYLLPGHGMPKMGGFGFLIKQILAGQRGKEDFI